jgi:DNA-binding IclR family transcriptional regulator
MDDIKSISRSANILECMSMGINRLSEIAAHCHYSKPTVHRLLKALEAAGLARQDPLNREYYLGTRLEKIHSYHHVTHECLITCSIEEMKQLSDYSEETVSIGIRSGVVYLQVHGIPSKHDLKVTEESIKTLPLFTGAPARALLSQLSDADLDKIMKILKFEKITDNTIIEKDLFLAQIKQARQRGYSISYGEKTPGVVCVAAPIFNYFVPAIIVVLGPEYRLQNRIEGLIQHTKESAGRISANVADFLR